MLGFDALGAIALGGSSGPSELGIATETDSALARIFDYPVEIALETDTALDMGRSVALGLTTETDSALSVSPFRTLAYAVETDEALHLAVPIGLLIEADTALSLRPVRAWAIGLATETDSVLALTLVDGQVVELGLAGETDSPLSLLQSRLSYPEETDTAQPISAILTSYWPYDELKPRHIGIYPCAAPIGGGVSLAGREPTIDSGLGYWRIEYGGVYVKDRAAVFKWRQTEALFEGRGRSLLVYLFDGKRAPWVTVGGTITATANAAVAAGATAITINATSAGTLLVGQHFSVGHYLYRIKTISGPVGSVYTCTIWPKTREAIASGAALEFARPILRVKLQDDNGMNLPLHLLKRGDGNVTFVEDVP